MRSTFHVAFLAILSIACSRSPENPNTVVPPEKVHLVARIPLGKNISETPLRISGEVTLPVLVHRVEPIIPVEEKARVRNQPFMIFELTIDQIGNVVDVKTLKSNDESLVPYVVAAIKQWKYKPATLRGAPVKVLYNITFTYEVR